MYGSKGKKLLFFVLGCVLFIAQAAWGNNFTLNSNTPATGLDWTNKNLWGSGINYPGDTNARPDTAIFNTPKGSFTFTTLDTAANGFDKLTLIASEDTELTLKPGPGTNNRFKFKAANVAHGKTLTIWTTDRYTNNGGNLECLMPAVVTSSGDVVIRGTGIP